MKEGGGAEVKMQSPIKAGWENATEMEEGESQEESTPGPTTSLMGDIVEDLRSVRPEEKTKGEREKGNRPYDPQTQDK